MLYRRNGYQFVLSLALLTYSTNYSTAQTAVPYECVEIPRLLPPVGIEVPDDVRTELQNRVNTILNANLSLVGNPRWPDVAVLLKAVQFALDLDEFYNVRDFDKARQLLALAEQRFDQLKAEKSEWASATGMVIRGYQSRIDGSYQPYGLEIPEGQITKPSPTPLYVWLHGRAERTTDMHFLHERMTRPGTIAVPDAIVLHPFGRQCVGFKSAGEIDVLEAIDDVCSVYPIDKKRIVLIGFSMGGAGAWHIGAHYTDRFVGVFPGAGFAETAMYNKLTPEKYPAKYEQTLWTVYDVPGYTRNFFNLPVIAYSGEKDAQIQAALVMDAAFRTEGPGHALTHLIGPNTEHRYEPETLRKLLEKVKQISLTGQNTNPNQLHLQTRSLRYATRRWFTVTSMKQLYDDTRVDARRTDDGTWWMTSRNVTSMRLDSFPMKTDANGRQLKIDGQTIAFTKDQSFPLSVELRQNLWRIAKSSGETLLSKGPGISGPIDDAFLDPFLVVTPSRKSKHAAIQSWTECELAHFRSRWQGVFRGHLRVKRDVDVTDEDLEKYHVVVWGDINSNALIEKVMSASPKTFPVRWSWDKLWIGAKEFSAETHVPALVYPNPLYPKRYVVFNSGPTFREAHDKTNSQQNPKLPDWAVLDITQPPNDKTAGRVVAADFFDNNWQLVKELKSD